MKTTIDIPETLYRRAKIRAVETGRTLKDLVLASLMRDLETETDRPVRRTFFERQRLLPEFAKFQRAGAFKPKPGARDITDLISEDRDGR